MATKKPVQLNLIILGDPGAGKATQSVHFAKKYNLFDFDMGRELTLLREKNAAVEAAQKRTADKGILTPTAIVRKINEQKIGELNKSVGILFDGHPKMVGEAKLVAKLLEKTGRTKPLVLYIKIPVSEIVKRTHKRLGYYNTKFSKRPDDSISALKNRARYYRTNIKQVTEYFKSIYTFAQIDGMGTKAQVRTRIQKAIDFYLKHYEEIYKTSSRN